MQHIAAILSGALFGAGVVISDMVNPGRVKAFLTISPDWDPTLAFVMAGALVPMAIAWFVADRVQKPAFADSFDLITPAGITPSLIFGSVIFGLGWGLVGYCPGPALAALLFEPWSAGIFIVSMLAGMLFRQYGLARPWPCN